MFREAMPVFHIIGREGQEEQEQSPFNGDNQPQPTF